MFVGSLLSSAMFLLLTGYVTMRTTQIPATGEGHNYRRMSAPLDFAKDGWNVFESFGSHQKEKKHVKSRKKELNKRKSLLSVVPVSRQTALPSYSILKKSWWQSSQNSKMVLDASSFIPSLTQDRDAMERLHFAANCTDFSSFSGQLEEEWSPRQLKCLLQDVFFNFGSHYNWFIISSAQTYLSVMELERLLETMDPLTVTYMGLPLTNDYCSVGPGLVLSRKAMEKLVPHLNDCLRDNEYTTADEYLGTCFMDVLDTQCYRLHKVCITCMWNKQTKLFTDIMISINKTFFAHDHRMNSLPQMFNDRHYFSVV